MTELKMFETQIKAVDLYAPLPTTGIVVLSAPVGHGALVLLHEILAQTSGAIALGVATRGHAPGDFARLFDDLEHTEPVTTTLLEPTGSPDERWAQLEVALNAQPTSSRSPRICVIDSPVLKGLPTLQPLRALATSRGVLIVIFEALERLGAQDERFEQLADVRLRFSTRLARQQIWPALDITSAHSKLNHQHAALVDRARQALASDAALASQIELYLSQPFFIAQTFTGLPGQRVSLDQAAQDLASILSGEWALRAPLLYMRGALDPAAAPIPQPLLS